jgi:hypothetical protein
VEGEFPLPSIFSFLAGIQVEQDQQPMGLRLLCTVWLHQLCCIYFLSTTIRAILKFVKLRQGFCVNDHMIGGRMVGLGAIEQLCAATIYTMGSHSWSLSQLGILI